MVAQSFDLAWIVVTDLKKAIKFYTDVVGLDLHQVDEELGWAELQGKNGGAYLGIAQVPPSGELQAGENAFLTFTVANLEQAKREMIGKGAKCIGDVHEVPGHVKMQMIQDNDGNQFQIVEKLDI